MQHSKHVLSWGISELFNFDNLLSPSERRHILRVINVILRKSQVKSLRCLRHEVMMDTPAACPREPLPNKGIKDLMSEAPSACLWSCAGVIS